MKELHTDSIDGSHEASYGLGHVPGRGRTPTRDVLEVCKIFLTLYCRVEEC
jgi:hypothetical protein